jgi:Protein of unknown function (DUF3352)
MRLYLAALLGGLVLAAGCGGGGDSAATGGDGAASIAPATAAIYATINTDVDSDQVDQLEELLAKFPDHDKLLAELQKGFAEEDVSWEADIKPALGETLDLVLLDFESGDFVFILKPQDKSKFEALLAKADGDLVAREIDGWTVAAEDEATLDRFDTSASGGSLEDDEQFADAMEGLPDEALAKIYVDGETATKAAEDVGGASSGENRLKAFAAAIGAESSGIRFDGALTAELEDQFASIEPYEPQLLEAAPEDALAFISGSGAGKVSEGFRQAPGTFDQLREMLGVDLEGITELFDGEFAFWVGQGAPIPEVTFLAEVENEQRALAALDRLATLIPAQGGANTPEFRTTEIDGVQAKQLVLEGFPITYAAFDGKVIVTSRPGAIADVRAEGDSLADDPDFEQASDNANMPDETFGFVYLDLDRLGALVEGIAGLSGGEIPPEAARYIEPLGALVFHSSGKAEDLKLSAFLEIE